MGKGEGSRGDGQVWWFDGSLSLTNWLIIFRVLPGAPHFPGKTTCLLFHHLFPTTLHPQEGKDLPDATQLVHVNQRPEYRLSDATSSELPVVPVNPGTWKNVDNQTVIRSPKNVYCQKKTLSIHLCDPQGTGGRAWWHRAWLQDLVSLSSTHTYYCLPWHTDSRYCWLISAPFPLSVDFTISNTGVNSWKLRKAIYHTQSL